MSRNRLAVLFTVILISTIAVIGATHRDLARDFWNALAGFPIAAIAAALLIVFGQVAAQGLRLWAIVPGELALSPGRVVASFMAGECANIVTPVRAGDALKVVLLTLRWTWMSITMVCSIHAKQEMCAWLILIRITKLPFKTSLTSLQRGSLAIRERTSIWTVL